MKFAGNNFIQVQQLVLELSLSKSDYQYMKWNNIQSQNQIDDVVNASIINYQAIFKHSTTCPISSMAKMRLESNWDLDNVYAHYLDLLSHRSISNYIADTLSVHHESPQLILLKNGEVIYDSSHLDISVDEIKEAIAYCEKR